MEQNEALSLYHTTLRNIGLFFTLHMGITSFSSNGIIKSQVINYILNINGIIFLLIAFLLSSELENYRKDDTMNISKNLEVISMILRYTIIFMIIKMVYGLFFK